MVLSSSNSFKLSTFTFYLSNVSTQMYFLWVAPHIRYWKQTAYFRTNIDRLYQLSKFQIKHYHYFKLNDVLELKWIICVYVGSEFNFWPEHEISTNPNNYESLIYVHVYSVYVSGLEDDWWDNYKAVAGRCSVVRSSWNIRHKMWLFTLRFLIFF